MDFNTIIIRFGELSTKGKNKKDFIFTLARSIKRHLIDYQDLYEMKINHDHIYLNLKEKNLDLAEILKNIQGMYSFSLALKVEDAELENINSIILEQIKKEEGKTFKVHARRIDKSYPYISDDINREVASNILKNTDLKVDVHNPDILISIEIRTDGAYIFTQTIKGIGGYPEGSIGKCMMMLSGGIDSPVASYLLMRRGVELYFIHFASPPYTNSGVINKLEDILTTLNDYQTKINLYIIPFTKIQEKIYEVSEKGYQVTIMRRMMYRIAARLAKYKNITCIANGESIGQVASQTLDSMYVINKVIDLPVIRPLATYDKNDIISISKKINTYDISIRPYVDCCTIFPVLEPKTSPKDKICNLIESKADFDSLIDEALTNYEHKVFKKDYK